MPIGLAEHYALALVAVFALGIIIGCALGKENSSEHRKTHTDRLEMKPVKKHAKGK